MPKVTDQYTESKKEFIMQCVNEVYQEKPLYQITMRDVIKKTGYSQGALYRYYANLDEIFLELINRNTAEFQLEQAIDDLLCSGRKERDIIADCILAIGAYIHDLLKLSAGKMYFELLVIYAHDAEKRERILPRLKFRESLACAQHKTAEYLVLTVQKGRLKPTISVQSLIMFTCVSIDGISNDAVLSAAGRSGDSPEFKVDVLDMFRVLAQSVAGFLVETNTSDGKELSDHVVL